jgi:hypothetical protein
MGRPRRYTDEAIKAAYIKCGARRADMARELGCSFPTVTKALDRLGLAPLPGVAVEPEPVEVKPVHVGLSGLVGAKVAFNEGTDYSMIVHGSGESPGK